jgi:mRNA-degrading endonuclease toxin of MazEF toxin-antitoxin module
MAVIASQTLPGIRRGQVYWVELYDTMGSEQRDLRPWLVVSKDELHKRFSTLIACPMSSSTAKAERFVGARIVVQPSKFIPTTHVSPTNKFLAPLPVVESLVLTEQVRTLAHSRLQGGKPVATIVDDALADVDAGLAFVLDL